MSMFAEVLIAVGLVTLLVAWVVRVLIFYPLQEDQIAATHLEGTFVTTFTDFLWVSLYRDRDKIDRQFRSEILAYFWLTLTTVVLWAAAAIAIWLAA